MDASASAVTANVASFESGHKDVIQDIAMDWYGNRMATCSADQTIIVWDADRATSSPSPRWTPTACWKAHTAVINKLCWAHPEYGQIIASCGNDHKVCVWAEVLDFSSASASFPSQSSSSSSSAATQPSSSSASVSTSAVVSPPATMRGTSAGFTKMTSRWVLRAELVDSRESVIDVAFAPPFHGLTVAALGSNDVHFYDATDLTTVGSWQLKEYEYFKTAQRPAEYTCLCWNPSPFDPPSLAVGAGRSVKVFIIAQSPQRCDLAGTLEGHEGTVLDVAWAPNVGRSFHLVATASKDHRVKIFRFALLSPTSPSATATLSAIQQFSGPQPSPALSLSPRSSDGDQAFSPPTPSPSSAGSVPTQKAATSSAAASSSSLFRLVDCATLTEHKAEVWRVRWNISGTVLASSADDGTVRLWKSAPNSSWVPVCSLQG